MKKYRNRIGIMNGRLSPMIDNQIQQFPVTNWKNEFKLASELGFDLIEWIFDLHPNPILNDDGIKIIKNLSIKNNIKVNSICADYFMKKKIFNVNENQLTKNIDILKKLIRSSRKLDIKIIVIPLLDESSISLRKNENSLIHNIKRILNYASDNDVFLALETDLNHNRVLNLIQNLDSNSLKINYDVGNSVAQGHDIVNELERLMSWIINIHIKDRKYNSYTVPLGEGDVDFDLFFSTLAKLGYRNDFIIQGARKTLHSNQLNDILTCKKYNSFIKRYVKKYLNQC